MATLEIYWSFRSPYSYLAIDRLAAIIDDYEVEHRFRLVRPIALREPRFFAENRPQWLPYLLKDIFREAERLGLPLASPRPDPIEMDLATGVIAPMQPLMDRLMRLGIAAERSAEQGLAFASAMSRRIWGGTENWHRDAEIAGAAREAGLDLAVLECWAEANAAMTADVIADNEARQLNHHWGVPLMVLDGEPFFGQDRLDSLLWRLDRRGLRRNEGS